MSLPRQILPGVTYLLTRRCSQRQFLLRPSRRTNAALLYVLALAAERTGVLLHAFCFLSNHYHLVVTDPRGTLPEFMRYFNEFTARALNASYGRWESFWAPGSYSAVRLLSPEDVIAKIAYTLANPAAGGLVRRLEEWPGLKSLPRELDGASIVALRPETFFRSEGPAPETCTVRLTRPPGFGDGASFVEAVERALREREHAAAAAVQASGRDFLGRRGVLRQSPLDSPATVEPRRALNPRIAGRDKWKRIEALLRLKDFVAAYRVAWGRFRDGVRDVLFPPGTYWARVHHHALCASP